MTGSNVGPCSPESMTHSLCLGLTCSQDTHLPLSPPLAGVREKHHQPVTAAKFPETPIPPESWALGPHLGWLCPHSTTSGPPVQVQSVHLASWEVHSPMTVTTNNVETVSGPLPTSLGVPASYEGNLGGEGGSDRGLSSRHRDRAHLPTVDINHDSLQFPSFFWPQLASALGQRLHRLRWMRDSTSQDCLCLP